MLHNTLSAMVYGLRYEAAHIISVELRPAQPDTLFPAYAPGAHIDLHLPNGVMRSYSLTNPLEQPDRYVVAVLHDRNSRGGSRYIHEQLRIGTPLQISAPRNHFQLHEEAQHSFLLAGSIGITPLYAMLQKLTLRPKTPTCWWCARIAAFVQALQALQGPGRTVRLHIDDETGGPPDLNAILAAQPAQSHFYCCGPQPALIKAFERTCEQLGHTQVHVGRFSAELPPRLAPAKPVATPWNCANQGRRYRRRPRSRCSIPCSRRDQARPTATEKASAAPVKHRCSKATSITTTAS